MGDGLIGHHLFILPVSGWKDRKTYQFEFAPELEHYYLSQPLETVCVVAGSHHVWTMKGSVPPPLTGTPTTWWECHGS